MTDSTLTPTEADEQIRRDMLVQWVMGQVNEWRQFRDNQFAKRWAEYYRLWRGFWGPEDKQKDQERSKLIAPALQQAVEMTVAEMEEAAFGRGQWVDIADDYDENQDQKDQALAMRDLLLGDLEDNNVPSAVAESFLNGALYGTGIGKVMVEETTRNGESYLKCSVAPIAPQNFVIDPSATCIDDALGCAHEIAVPRHKVLRKQQKDVYHRTPVGSWQGEPEMFDMQGKHVLNREVDRANTVFITEYHGLVPKKLLDPSFDPSQDEDPLKDENGTPLFDDGELVEAIITIGNKSVLLRDKANPLDNDRAIVAYQHETVPNQFWGRGVSEKGYNPQKALDAELRARIDALGILAYPVVGFDATRLPKGQDTRLTAGKRFLFNGRPSEIMEPIAFGNLDPAIFQNSSDLERMVQMGTGAMDSATPTDVNARNATFGGTAMQFSSFIKRSKRTMRNVEDDFLVPLIMKIIRRYVEFSPERYPDIGFRFRVKSSMGIMAREVEQGLLTQLIQVVPPESPLFAIVLKGVIENGAAPNKAELMKAIDKMMTPDPNQQAMQDQQQQLQMEALQWQIKELQSKVGHNLASAELSRAKAEYTGVQSDLEDDKVQIQAAQTAIGAQKVHMDNTNKVAALAHQGAQSHIDRLHEAAITHLNHQHEHAMTEKQQAHEQQMTQMQKEHEANQNKLNRGHETKNATEDRQFNAAEAGKDRTLAKEQASLKAAQAAKKPGKK